MITMEFGKEKILEINTEDNFNDITFVAPYSLNENNQQKSIQVNKLLKEIKENVWGCDLILCLFFAALNSYRSDRCLRPFPPLYINEEGKNFNDLRSTCDSIPPLNTILNEPNKCSEDVKMLLMWLFLEKGYPILKRINFNNILFPSSFDNVFKPHFIFEVCYSEKFQSLWKKRQYGKNTILAYHGSAIDNFYSILKVGLQQHFSYEKEVLFGNGIYLSNEFSISAHYSPYGQTWFNSSLGSKHSVIALCEIINDLDKVKCKDEKYKSRSVNENSMGKIPEKYFVVTDSDMVRVKYLMVYRQKQSFSMKNYITENLFLFLIILYIISILAIGFFSNSSYLKSLRKFAQIFSFEL